MTDYARAERAGLCDDFLRLGPDAPTLCEGWAANDLAAHLVVRERRPDGAIGIVLPAAAGHTQKLMDDLKAGDWPGLVQKVRSGPPKWSPMAIPAVDEKVNLLEFFVHHEDLLRGDPATWTPRELSPELADAVWSGLASMTALSLRSVPVGVVAAPDGLGRRNLHSAKDGHGSVVLSGPLSDIVMVLFGRPRTDAVTLDGADADVATFEGLRLGN
ncbi:TIGR03085 family metal-binding protein [Branchiibius cervicis]|uniref:TIGR03085 family metal-binding protein n=1 Tax=Branchiibius cervicis TaxID=908252 RepID=A0ABW2ASJ7_9MICO